MTVTENTDSCHIKYNHVKFLWVLGENNRDYMIRYGEVLLWLHEVKITSGDFTTLVEVRLSHRT